LNFDGPRDEDEQANEPAASASSAAIRHGTGFGIETSIIRCAREPGAGRFAPSKAEAMMKTFLALLVTVGLSTPTFAQQAHFDPASTRRAAAAAAGTPPQPTLHRTTPFIAGVTIGASAGAVAGLLLTAGCESCSTPKAMLGGAWAGGLLGALVGGVIGAYPQRRPGIPLGAHVTAAPAVSRSRSRTAGGVTIGF
jgi:hypothetical protein